MKTCDHVTSRNAHGVSSHLHVVHGAVDRVEVRAGLEARHALFHSRFRRIASSGISRTKSPRQYHWSPGP